MPELPVGDCSLPAEDKGLLGETSESLTVIVSSHNVLEQESLYSVRFDWKTIVEISYGAFARTDRRFFPTTLITH
jgi:hypothetical protein